MNFLHKPFDFHLSEENEQWALRLHRDSIIIDTLYQGPIGPNYFPQDMEALITAKIQQYGSDIFGLFKLRSIPVRLAIAGRNKLLRDHWLGSGVTGGNREIELSNYQVFVDLCGLAQAQFDHFDWMIKATKADDFRRAKAENKAAGYISTQMVSGPFPSLEMLENAWEAGLRMLQLTYNAKNTLGGGCMDAGNSGVTDFGRDAIKMMNELGVIVDTGHCGKQTTLDACKLSDKPVVASHTVAAAVYNHQRGKSDDEIKAIAATAGIIGIVTVPFFLSDVPGVNINHFLDHIDYVSRLVGPQYVAIGTDWPNQIPNTVMSNIFEQAIKGVGFRKEHGVNPLACLDGFKDYLDFPNITRGLVARGYSGDEIQGILGQNFLRVFETVCG